jgi:S1-C subfamily serine protease
MEELNKNQIVLLTLLISFVTSIATGIVTVTLMDQAPTGVTQTINRVVERTIERVVPGEVTTKTVVKEVPVIVTEEELVVKVINDASGAVVRIESNDGTPVGSGFIASDDGFVITAARILGQPSEGQSYKIGLRNGDKPNARLIKFSLESDIAVMRIDSSELKQLKDKLVAAVAATSTEKIAWTPLTLQTTEISPGQTVIALGSPDSGPLNVSVGIISASGKSETNPTVNVIRTSAANQYNLGGPVLNTKGKVVGLSHEPGFAVSVDSIKEFINSITTTS